VTPPGASGIGALDRGWPLTLACLHS
jgi:hypothetical protein